MRGEPRLSFRKLGHLLKAKGIVGKHREIGRSSSPVDFCTKWTILYVEVEDAPEDLSK